MNADAQSSRLGALSSSLRGQHSFLSSSLLSDSALSQKRVVPLDFDDTLGVTINGSKSWVSGGTWHIVSWRGAPLLQRHPWKVPPSLQFLKSTLLLHSYIWSAVLCSHTEDGTLWKANYICRSSIQGIFYTPSNQLMDFWDCFCASTCPDLSIWNSASFYQEWWNFQIDTLSDGSFLHKKGAHSETTVESTAISWNIDCANTQSPLYCFSPRRCPRRSINADPSACVWEMLSPRALALDLPTGINAQHCFDEA